MTARRRVGLAITNTLLDLLVLGLLASQFSSTAAWALVPWGWALAFRIHGAPRPRARGVRGCAVGLVCLAAWGSCAAVSAFPGTDGPDDGFFLAFSEHYPFGIGAHPVGDHLKQGGRWVETGR